MRGLVGPRARMAAERALQHRAPLRRTRVASACPPLSTEGTVGPAKAPW